MENTYGYIRTSRQRIAGEAGSDPEAQALQLRGAGAALGGIDRDVGVSGSICPWLFPTVTAWPFIASYSCFVNPFSPWRPGYRGCRAARLL